MAVALAAIAQSRAAASTDKTPPRNRLVVAKPDQPIAPEAR
jgi:hypothetical protein